MTTALQNLNFIVSLTDRVTKPLGGIMGKLDGLHNRFTKGALNIGIGTGGLYAVSSTFDSLTEKAISFEKEMANVSKATNQPLDVTMKGLGQEVLKLGRTLPIAHEQLAQIMATGAKSDIAQRDLSKYTELVAKVATAWETTADETAIDVAKLSNIFQKPILEMGRFTDAINKLDDVSASSAPEIVDVLKRVGGSAVAIRMSELQAAALSTTLLDLGETSEKAGTGINALLERIGSPALQNKTFANTLTDIGWSVQKMEQSVKSGGAQQTILDLFDTISKFDDQKKRDVLGGLFGSEYADNLSKLANNMDKYRSRISAVTDEQSYLNSVNKEFDNRMSATAYKLELFNNRMNELKIGFGGVLVDILEKTFPNLFSGLDTMNDKFATFTEQHPLLTKAIGYAVVGLGGLVAVLSVGAIMWGIFTLAMIPALIPFILIVAAVGALAWAINAGSQAVTDFLVRAAPIEYLVGKWEALRTWWASFKGWLASLDPFGALLGGINNVIAKVSSIGTALRSALSVGGIAPGLAAGGGGIARNITGKILGGNSSTKNVTVNVNNNGGSASPAAIGHHLRMAGG